MDDLQTVCRTMLDNADMDIEFTDFPFAVRLTFYVVGTDKKVVFECANIASFHLTKDADEDPLYVVLETRVTEPRQQRPAELSDHEFSLLDQTDYLWRIDIEAAIDLRIASRDLSWRVERMSEEELHGFNAPGATA